MGSRGLLTVAAVLELVGCSLTSQDAIVPAATASLSPSEIAARLERADALFREPRKAERVIRSYEICVSAASPTDEEGAYWRAARACLWLAQYHPNVNSRGDWAAKGVAVGDRATRDRGRSPRGAPAPRPRPETRARCR